MTYEDDLLTGYRPQNALSDLLLLVITILLLLTGVIAASATGGPGTCAPGPVLAMHDPNGGIDERH